jgi:hypothetical protein
VRTHVLLHSLIAAISFSPQLFMDSTWYHHTQD